MRICDIADEDIFNAGKYKVKNTNLSIADCIAVACARREGAIILTTESEMKNIKQVKVRKLDY